MGSRKKVIATVINDLHYDQRMIKICTSLSNMGYEVVLIGRKKVAHAPVERVYQQKRLNVPFKSGPLFYLFYNIQLFFKLLFSSFDIVHAVDLDSLTAASVVARLRSKKLVYDAHEYFTEVPELMETPKKKALWKWIEKTFVPRADAAMTVGSELARLFTEEYHKDFHVVRNAPVLQAETHKEEESQQPFILYQGALNKGRGLELLIDAMSDIPMPLKIAGSGDLDDQLMQMVKDKKLEDKVEFTGLLEPEELAQLTTKAYIAYNVSENLGLSYYYSLNNKFFDYIHAGVPAVTNNFPEYVALNQRYNCCVFTKYEREDLIDKILLLLNDRDLYVKLKKNCVLAKQELNWGAEEKKLEAVYESISE